MASRKTQWPVGRGFERFYGFLGAETNQWYPDLVYDNHPVEQPAPPSEGYHLTVDLTDKALEFNRNAKAVAPDKPFFLYFCPGACHAPHHAPKEWIDKYLGKFDMGYEAYRELVFERQKRMGVVTDKAELSPINPYIDATSAEGKGWPELDTVRPWDALTDDEKRLFARMAEVYVGFLSHADHQIGRLLDYLEQSGQLDNTIIVLVSDNGASGEGGPNGSVNENKIFNGLPDNIEANLPHLEELGSPLTYNHYPTGWAWAFNTPFKLWNRYSNYEGGTADPMIISWPAQINSTGLRCQYVHAVDIVPTLYSMLGIELPEVVKGYTQFPLEGISFDATFHDATATTDKQTQFYSMGGTRTIWHQGWKEARRGRHVRLGGAGLLCDHGLAPQGCAHVHRAGGGADHPHRRSLPRLGPLPARFHHPAPVPAGDGGFRLRARHLRDRRAAAQAVRPGQGPRRHDPSGALLT